MNAMLAFIDFAIVLLLAIFLWYYIFKFLYWRNFLFFRRWLLVVLIASIYHLIPPMLISDNVCAAYNRSPYPVSACPSFCGWQIVPGIPENPAGCMGRRSLPTNAFLIR